MNHSISEKENISSLSDAEILDLLLHIKIPENYFMNINKLILKWESV